MMKKKLQVLNEVFKHLEFRIFQYKIEEIPIEINATNIEKESYRITIYSKIHKSAEWKKEFSYKVTNKKIDIYTFLELKQLIENIKAFYEFLGTKNLENIIMFSYKDIFLKFIDLDFKNKIIKGKIIDSTLKNYIPIKNEKIKINLIKNFHKLKFYKNNEFHIVGNSIYINGIHKQFTSNKKLDRYLKENNL